MIGVESAFGFGDCMFNVPFTKAIADYFDDKLCIASINPDAFYNLPWIKEIHKIHKIDEGRQIFKDIRNFQITQDSYFNVFAEEDPNHSLIDTPLKLASVMGFNNFDQRPIFIPTEDEIKVGSSLWGERTIAIESAYFSGQSWVQNCDIDIIIKKYKNTHKILWLSNTPNPPGTKDCSAYTRRELIVAIKGCELFFSVGSGFFCASMAKGFQPKKIICLWIDEPFKYIDRINQLKWHPNIIWLLNRKQLEDYLTVPILI